MRAVIQRVSSAKVYVDDYEFASIDKGYLILLGVLEEDTEKEAKLLAEKVSTLRIFNDEDNKMNLSILDIEGEALVVSQFTLCACCKKGNRPSFSDSAQPERAEGLYELFMEELKALGVKKVEKGQFGAAMQVSLVNNGPVTIMYDTDIWAKKN